MGTEQVTSLRTALLFLVRGDTRAHKLRLAVILGTCALSWALGLTLLALALT